MQMQLEWKVENRGGDIKKRKRGKEGKGRLVGIFERMEGCRGYMMTGRTESSFVKQSNDSINFSSIHLCLICIENQQAIFYALFLLLTNSIFIHFTLKQA